MVDYLQEALSSSRRVFASVHNHLFLLCDGVLEKPDKPGKTASCDPLEATTTAPGGHGAARARDKAHPLLILAVRKVIATFPNMITVGRTANNDVVVPDISVSKFHAWFQRTATKIELGDAGSKNGTRANNVALAPRGALVPVKIGDRLRFGRIEFALVDAGAAWDAVERRR